jgi:hypothetical protein
MEESQIIEIWDIFKEYVPEKNREVAAGHYVDFLVGKDVEISVLEGLMGYDPHLDTAIELVTGDDAEEDDDGYDENGWGDEDEDY